MKKRKYCTLLAQSGWPGGLPQSNIGKIDPAATAWVATIPEDP
jgi:hypothetical protein